MIIEVEATGRTSRLPQVLVGLGCWSALILCRLVIVFVTFLKLLVEVCHCGLAGVF